MGNNRPYPRMKKNILLAVALMLSAITLAQPQLATLNHNNTITPFYGSNALVQAHAAAVAGDIITLSSGVFNSTNITKPITLRGAGAWGDTNIGATILRNGFRIQIEADNTHHLTMEGINVPHTVILYTIYNPQFIKCFFQRIGHGTSDDEHGQGAHHASFVNCIIGHWHTHVDYYASHLCNVEGTQFINSVIMDCDKYNILEVYTNCIVKQDPVYATSRMFQNCILYYARTQASTPANNGTTSFNCLFVQTSTAVSDADNLFASTAGHVLWNIRGLDSVFSTFYGSTIEESFRLLPTAASTYIGTDGTQIGIYGGAMPFDPRVTNPLIRRVSVAPRSTPTGQLSVDIEVVNE